MMETCEATLKVNVAPHTEVTATCGMDKDHDGEWHYAFQTIGNDVRVRYQWR